MNRKEEIKILIPQLEEKYGNAHDIAKAKHEEQLVRIKKHFSLVLDMSIIEFDLWFNEHSTSLTFEVNGEKSGDLKIYHPVNYSSIDDVPFRLSWYSTSACDINNPQHLVYLTSLGKVAEDFNGNQYIQTVLEGEIRLFKEGFKEQREIGTNIENLKRELQEIERVEKFTKVYDDGGISGDFEVYGYIVKGRTRTCNALTIDKVTDKTVTVTFDSDFYGKETKRLKKREADGLFVSLIDSINEKVKL